MQAARGPEQQQQRLNTSLQERLAEITPFLGPFSEVLAIAEAEAQSSGCADAETCAHTHIHTLTQT